MSSSSSCGPSPEKDASICWWALDEYGGIFQGIASPALRGLSSGRESRNDFAFEILLNSVRGAENEVVPLALDNDERGLGGSVVLYYNVSLCNRRCTKHFGIWVLLTSDIPGNAILAPPPL